MKNIARRPDISDVYFVESEKLLGFMRDSLYSLQYDIKNANSLYTFLVAIRAFKDLAFMYEYNNTALYAETMHNLLSMINNKTIELSDSVLKTLFCCYDCMYRLIVKRMGKKNSFAVSW